MNEQVKDDGIINHVRNVKLLQAVYSGKKFYVDCMPTDEGAITFPNSNKAFKEIELPEFKLYEEEKFGYKWIPAESTPSSLSLTLGMLISAAENIEMDLQESKKEITPDVWDQLVKDNFCPNSIPIHYMKRLILKLGVPFWMAAEAIKYTFSTYAINNPIPLHGDQNRHLWENEESITKYIVRLQELIKEPSLSLEEAAIKAASYAGASSNGWNAAEEEISKQSFIAGWNARDSQQTGVLLTREVFDKIWEECANSMSRHAFGEGSVRISKVIVDQETFAKQFNL